MNSTSYLSVRFYKTIPNQVNVFNNSLSALFDIIVLFYMIFLAIESRKGC